jgi:hypothetical protein
MSGFFGGGGGVALGYDVAYAFVSTTGTIVAAGAVKNITSVTRNGAGDYTVDFTAAGFTLQPSIHIQLMQDNGNVLRYEYLFTATNTDAQILIYDAANVSTDNRFRFFAIGDV